MAKLPFEERFSEPSLIKRDAWGSILRVKDGTRAHPRIVRRLDEAHRGRPLARAALEAEVGYSEALGNAPCARAELIELDGPETIIGYTGAGGVRLDRLLDAPQLAGYRLTQHGAIALATDLLVAAIAVQQIRPPTAAGRSGWGHGEITPSNVMVGASGSGRLLNATFAVSGVREVDPPPLSKLCTPPEAADTYASSGAGDVYAVGVILAASVLGPAALLAARKPLATSLLLELEALGPQLDTLFVDAVVQALATKPADRHDSPAALLAALRACGSVDDLRIAVARIALALERPGQGLTDVAQRYPMVLALADYAMAEADSPTGTDHPVVADPEAEAVPQDWVQGMLQRTRSSPADIMGRALDQAVRAAVQAGELQPAQPGATAVAAPPPPVFDTIEPPRTFLDEFSLRMDELRAPLAAATLPTPTPAAPAARLDGADTEEHPAIGFDDHDGPTLIGEGALLSAIITGQQAPIDASARSVGVRADSLVGEATDGADDARTKLDLPEIGVQAFGVGDIARLVDEDPELAEAIAAVFASSNRSAPSESRPAQLGVVHDRAADVVDDHSRTPLAIAAIPTPKTPPPALEASWAQAVGGIEDTGESEIARDAGIIAAELPAPNDGALDPPAPDDVPVTGGASFAEEDAPTQLGDTASPALLAAAARLRAHTGGGSPAEADSEALTPATSRAWGADIEAPSPTADASPILTTLDDSDGGEAAFADDSDRPPAAAVEAEELLADADTALEAVTPLDHPPASQRDLEPVTAADLAAVPRPTMPVADLLDGTGVEAGLDALSDSSDGPTAAALGPSAQMTIPAAQTVLGAVTIPPDHADAFEPPTVAGGGPAIVAAAGVDAEAPAASAQDEIGDGAQRGDSAEHYADSMERIPTDSAADAQLSAADSLAKIIGEPPRRPVEARSAPAPESPLTAPSQDPPMRFDGSFRQPDPPEPSVMAPLLARTALVAAVATALGFGVFVIGGSQGPSPATGSGLGAPQAAEATAAKAPSKRSGKPAPQVIYRDRPATGYLEEAGAAPAASLDAPEASDSPAAADRAASLLFESAASFTEDEEPLVNDLLEPADELPDVPTQLVVNVIPWGQVFIDGEDHGYPPVFIDATQPGVHHIRVERTGFDRVTREVTVTEGTRKIVHIRLYDR